MDGHTARRRVPLRTVKGTTRMNAPSMQTNHSCGAACGYRRRPDKQEAGVARTRTPKLVVAVLAALVVTVTCASTAHAQGPVIAASGDQVCGSNSTGRHVRREPHCQRARVHQERADGARGRPSARRRPVRVRRESRTSTPSTRRRGAGRACARSRAPWSGTTSTASPMRRTRPRPTARAPRATSITSARRSPRPRIRRTASRTARATTRTTSGRGTSSP